MTALTLNRGKVRRRASLRERFIWWWFRRLHRKLAIADARIVAFDKYPHDSSTRTTEVLRRVLKKRRNRIAYKLDVFQASTNLLPAAEITRPTL